MRGRFAPSPTGYMHLGNAWIALMAWLQARSAGGTIVLRMEDIDEQRSQDKYATAIIEDLRWLGLDWDEGPDCGGPSVPYVQQQRYALYNQDLAALRDKGVLYPCYCNRARLQAIGGAPHAGEQQIYDQHCYHLTESERAMMKKTPSWRIHVPEETISFVDGLYGRQIAFLPQSCGDFVVRRSDGMYAYQLAVSADDAAMGITHVVRGNDLLSSTAQQIWLIRLLGGKEPQYMHVPMLLDESGRRLSKRQKGITLRQLKDEGITPFQVIAYLAYKGNLINHYEECSPGRLLKDFDTKKLQKNNIIVENDVFSSIQYLVSEN